MSEERTRYIERSTTVLESFSQMSERDIEMKIVQPLLELLGWDQFNDVKSQYAIPAGTTSLNADYVLFIEETTEVIIEVKSLQSLQENSRDQLRSYMRQAEADWGMLTNGRTFQVLNLNPNSQSSEDVLIEAPIENLDTEWDKIEILSKENIRSGKSYDIKEQLSTRKKGIELLEQKESEIKQNISEYILEETNDSLSSDLDEEVDSLVDNLIRNLSADHLTENLPRNPESILETLGTRLPGRSEEVRHERATYVLSVYNFLREAEKTTNDELKNILSKKHSNSLPNEEVDRQWTNYIRENLSELPRVEPPARGASQIWRYISPELEQQIQVDEVENWILDLKSIPTGNSGSKERQRAVIQQSYDYLKKNGHATKKEINAILPNYTAHYQDFRGFWSYCIREALKQRDDIEAPVAGHQDWRYIGEQEMPPELDIKIDDWVVNLNVSGQKMTKKEREALLQYSYEFLRESGEAQRGDFEEQLRDNIPSEIGRYNRFQGLWTYLLKDGLKAAPRVQTHSPGKKNPTIYIYSD